MVPNGMCHQCTIPVLLLSWAIEFCMVEPKIYSVIMAVSPLPPLHTKMRISSHVTSRKFQIMVRFTGQSTTVGLQYGIYVTLLALRICRKLPDFWKIYGPL
jgi:hypothetical protein